MKISEISVAVNYAKVQSQLTQNNHTGGKTQTVSEKEISELKFAGSLISSDNGYTREDAILSQWNKMGSFNLYDVLNGTGTIKLQNPNPSAEEFRAFEKSLQENGIQGNIDLDLSNFAFDLRGIGFGTNNPIYRLSPDDFSRKTDYIASRYAAMQMKIQTSFSGAERNMQMKRLDTIYKEALAEMAAGYSGITGDFLSQNGVQGEKDKIHRSFIDEINGRAAEYRMFLSENPDFAGLKGTKDEWLLQDDEYMAALLRGRGMDAASASSVSGQYSFIDLDVLGRYVSELSSWERSSNAVNRMDEERIGLDFAMFSMKTEVIRKGVSISHTMAHTLQNLMNGFMNGFLDRLDSQLADLRKAGAASKDQKGYAKLDRQSVWDVYHKTMGYYKVSGNALEALMEGAKFGAGKAFEKAESGIYRYLNTNRYWEGFFEKDAKEGAKPYASGETIYQQYAAGWKSFESSLQVSSMGIQLNMELKSAEYYQNAFTSWVDVRA